MSYEIGDDIESGVMSGCCSAAVINPSGEQWGGICADCKEHCESVSEDEDE